MQEYNIKKALNIPRYKITEIIWVWLLFGDIKSVAFSSTNPLNIRSRTAGKPRDIGISPV